MSASYPGAKLAINPIDAEGRVGERPTQVLATEPKAHCVVVDPSNRWAYCTNLGGDIIMQLRFDAATRHGRRPIRRPRSPPSPAPGRGIWRFTRTAGFCTC